MLVLPKELEITDLSMLAACDQRETCPVPGKSGRFAMLRGLRRLFRDGIIIPRLPIVGEESGEDCSASVE